MIKLVILLSSLAAVLPVLNAKNAKNIVMILTDDQDIHLKSVEPMKNVLNLIANKGATFENAVS